ncbi:hypothetical protein B0H10DRAFT_1939127 [Mycena sp. CBHHK59/15]|nr:hypothetical protein B0H10DRAFT_1939127 [Mycena sp. CBHHK59/15]
MPVSTSCPSALCTIAWAMCTVRCILVVSHAYSVHAPRVRWDTSQHLGGAPVRSQRVFRSWQGGSARGSAQTRKTTPTLQWSQNRQGHSTLQMVHSVHAAGLAEVPERAAGRSGEATSCSDSVHWKPTLTCKNTVEKQRDAPVTQCLGHIAAEYHLAHTATKFHLPHVAANSSARRAIIEVAERRGQDRDCEHTPQAVQNADSRYSSCSPSARLQVCILIPAAAVPVQCAGIYGGAIRKCGVEGEADVDAADMDTNTNAELKGTAMRNGGGDGAPP